MDTVVRLPWLSTQPALLVLLGIGVVLVAATVLLVVINGGAKRD